MSTYGIDVPSPSEHDYHADLCQQRRQAALKSLTPDDVLAQIDDLIASEPDAEKHPCFAMVAWMLDQRLEPGHGGEFWDAWKVLAWQAIDRLVEARLQGEG